jgi:hypothetical protein
VGCGSVGFTFCASAGRVTRTTARPRAVAFVS